MTEREEDGACGCLVAVLIFYGIAALLLMATMAVRFFLS